MTASDSALAPNSSIFGIEVADLDYSEAVALLQQRIEKRHATKLAFLNANGANLAWEDEGYRTAFRDFLIFADGIGVDIAAKLLNGRPFRANLNGTDFIPNLLRATARPLKIGLVGGKPGIAEKAAMKLAEVAPHHRFPIIHSGFMTDETREALLARMRHDPLDLLLVAMGNPLQEHWIHRHIAMEHATIAAGVGGLFDFMSGNAKRAPEWVRQLRIEWIFRLLQEPKRLFLRYVVGNPLFLIRILMTKLRLRVFQ
jgi:exopolysaccharide biosynthesis WecB/TagA/CpsF family protein